MGLDSLMFCSRQNKRAGQPYQISFQYSAAGPTNLPPACSAKGPDVLLPAGLTISATMLPILPHGRQDPLPRRLQAWLLDTILFSCEYSDDLSDPQ